jgi:hypothetical protein
MGWFENLSRETKSKLWLGMGRLLKRMYIISD